MTPLEARKLWSDALRSGEYAQTQRTLCRVVAEETAPVGYCCLGVACELYSKHVKPLERLTKDGFTAFITNDGEVDRNHSAYLPPPVADWLNITINGHLTEPVIYPIIGISGQVFNGNAVTVADLNDSAKFDFTQIADIIDAGKVQDALPQSTETVG